VAGRVVAVATLIIEIAAFVSATLAAGGSPVATTAARIPFSKADKRAMRMTPSACRLASCLLNRMACVLSARSADKRFRVFVWTRDRCLNDLSPAEEVGAHEQTSSPTALIACGAKSVKSDHHTCGRRHLHEVTASADVTHAAVDIRMSAICNSTSVLSASVPGRAGSDLEARDRVVAIERLGEGQFRRFSTGYHVWIEVERQQLNWRENSPLMSLDALGNDALDVVRKRVH
jgi:hypothetical protein